MSRKRRRMSFRLVDLMMTIAVISILLAMVSYGIRRARRGARRNQCQSNIRQLGLALYGTGSSPWGFRNVSTAADRQGENEIGLPLVGKVTIDGQDYSAPGAADATNGGYSWLVRILDSMCEVRLYDEIKKASHKYKEPAFSKSMVRQDANGQTMHFCRIPVPYLKCPSYTGGFNADEKEEIYKSDYRHPRISNYVCIPGTHFKSRDELVENGVIVSRRECDRVGCRVLSQDDILDGMSKTIMLAETREPNYASWYDGQVNWVTAFSPQYVADFGDGSNVVDQDPTDGVPDVVDDWTMALNFGPSNNGDTENVFMSQSPYTKDQSYGGRRWGPSSMHANGVVLHTFADGHTAVLTGDIDPSLYYALVTRNGSDYAGGGGVVIRE
jgi:hypothetical protein